MTTEAPISVRDVLRLLLAAIRGSATTTGARPIDACLTAVRPLSAAKISTPIKAGPNLEIIA